MVNFIIFIYYKVISNETGFIFCGENQVYVVWIWTMCRFICKRYYILFKTKFKKRGLKSSVCVTSQTTFKPIALEALAYD